MTARRQTEHGETPEDTHMTDTDTAVRLDRRSTPSTPPSTPRWVKVFGIIFILLILLIVIMHLAGYGFGGHEGHIPPASIIQYGVQQP